MDATRTDFDTLYQDNVADIRRFVLRMVQDPAVADELTQDVFLKAYRAWDNFRGDVSERIWLFRIARNTCLDHWRSPRAETRRPASLDHLGVGGLEPDPDRVDPSGHQPALSVDQAARQAQMSACVQDFVASLPETLRSPLILHDVDGLTHAEIAETLGCSIAAAKMRLHRARTRLQDMMEQRCDLFADERNVLSCLPVPDGAPPPLPDP